MNSLVDDEQFYGFKIDRISTKRIRRKKHGIWVELTLLYNLHGIAFVLITERRHDISRPDALHWILVLTVETEYKNTEINVKFD